MRCSPRGSRGWTRNISAMPSLRRLSSPAVADWFNEGLASLYEQSSVGDGTIKGLPNWRLPALQRAIRVGQLQSTAELISDLDFRAADRVGINYAQARYLMLYLQDHGQL